MNRCTIGIGGLEVDEASVIYTYLHQTNSIKSTGLLPAAHSLYRIRDGIIR
jgi:hypothetical protein